MFPLALCAKREAWETIYDAKKKCNPSTISKTSCSEKTGRCF